MGRSRHSTSERFCFRRVGVILDIFRLYKTRLYLYHQESLYCFNKDPTDNKNNQHEMQSAWQ